MDPAGADIDDDLHERPVAIAQELIRFETVNPPGDERPCIEWIGAVLDAYDIEYETFARDPDRPNLFARVPGGDASPLLLYGHVDVVPVTGQEWRHDPFAGVIEDGHLWGRGALDMKGGLAMLLAATLRAAVADDPPPGDVCFLAVADEEAGGDDGLAYLVEDHPELFDGIDHAIGEFGGFSFDFGGTEVYPIQTNEKQVCWLEVTFRGTSGHASLPTTDTAVGAFARFAEALEDARLPVHHTATAEAMIEGIAEAADGAAAERYRALLDPERTDDVLDELGPEGRMLDAVLHNTANITMVHGGDKENVVPETLTAVLDCRLVPGQRPEDVIAEIEAVTGMTDLEVDVRRFDPGPPEADLEYYEELAAVLEAATGKPAVPLLMFGGTDGRHLAAVDIQSYGFLPMRLGDLPFLDLVHSGDERIPVETIEWGTERIVEAIDRTDR